MFPRQAESASSHTTTSGTADSRMISCNTNCDLKIEGGGMGKTTLMLESGIKPVFLSLAAGQCTTKYVRDCCGWVLILDELVIHLFSPSG